MTVQWGAANARARGLATHLLDREALVAAAGAASWEAAARILVEGGYPAQESGARLTPQEFDRATGRVLADRLAVLSRWLGPRCSALAALSEEAEYRVLRRLLRGAAEGASVGARLRGTTPTPGLPERSLELLARAESPAQLVKSLIRMGHPAGPALAEAGSVSQASELWRLERTLILVFSRRVIRATRGAGRAFRRFAAMLIDLQNAEALLLSREWGTGVSPDDVFLPGGLVLDRARFATATGLDTERIQAVLRDWFANTPLARVFGDDEDPRSFEARALAALLAWQRREARRDPLGPGVLLEVMARMRAEAHDVRLVSSAVQLGAPPGVAAAGLVTSA